MKSLWFIFQNDHLLFRQETTLASASASLAETITLFECPTDQLQHSLKMGFFADKECYCAQLKPGVTLPHNVKALSLRAALHSLGENWFSILVRAHALLNWNLNHQFCGRCGTPTLHVSARFERCCPHCKLTFYPRISPSMIVRIKKEDHILLARGIGFTPGAYGLIAGFVEPGESIEETVHREVLEEVGICITNLQYVTSQPWPFPDSLMIGFTADYLSGEIVIDHTELETAGWFRYNQLPGLPSTPLSLSYQLIDAFVAEQEKEHKL